MSTNEYEVLPIREAPSTQDLIGLPAEGKVSSLTPRQATNVAKTRLSWAISNLVLGKVQDVSKWLDDLARTNPKEAIELTMQLAEYTLPRLKAAQVIVQGNADLTPGERQLHEMTLEELEALANGRG